MMLGKRAFLKRYWLFSWYVTAPAIVAVVAFFSVIGSTAVPVVADYTFPNSAVALGWTIALAPMTALVVIAGVQFARAPAGLGLLGKLRFTLKSGGPMIVYYCFNYSKPRV